MITGCSRLLALCTVFLGCFVWALEIGEPEAPSTDEGRCFFNGEWHKNNTDFEVGCSQRCKCTADGVTCVDLCGTTFVAPDFGHNCRLVYPKDECCGKWLCENHVEELRCEEPPMVNETVAQLIDNSTTWLEVLSCIDDKEEHCRNIDSYCAVILLNDKIMLTNRHCAMSLKQNDSKPLIRIHTLDEPTVASTAYAFDATMQVRKTKLHELRRNKFRNFETEKDFTDKDQLNGLSDSHEDNDRATEKLSEPELTTENPLDLPAESTSATNITASTLKVVLVSSDESSSEEDHHDSVTSTTQRSSSSSQTTRTSKSRATTATQSATTNQSTTDNVISSNQSDSTSSAATQGASSTPTPQPETTTAAQQTSPTTSGQTTKGNGFKINLGSDESGSAEVTTTTHADDTTTSATVKQQQTSEPTTHQADPQTTQTNPPSTEPTTAPASTTTDPNWFQLGFGGSSKKPKNNLSRNPAAATTRKPIAGAQLDSDSDSDEHRPRTRPSTKHHSLRLGSGNLDESSTTLHPLAPEGNASTTRSGQKRKNVLVDDDNSDEDSSSGEKLRPTSRTKKPAVEIALPIPGMKPVQLIEDTPTPSPAVRVTTTASTFAPGAPTEAFALLSKNSNALLEIAKNHSKVDRERNRQPPTSRDKRLVSIPYTAFKALVLVDLDMPVPLPKHMRPINLPLSDAHCKRLVQEGCSVSQMSAPISYRVNTTGCRNSVKDSYFWISSAVPTDLKPFVPPPAGEGITVTSGGVDYLVGLVSKERGPDDSSYEDDSTETSRAGDRVTCVTVISICPYLDWFEDFVELQVKNKRLEPLA